MSETGLKKGDLYVARVGGGILDFCSRKDESWGEVEVEARCKKANADAEALEIEARYEVRTAP